MASLNKVFLMGNLTRNPELRYNPKSGSAVCEFGLAVNRIFKGADGAQKKDTCFVDINVWGHLAETCEKYIQKGSLVLVEGRIQMDTWKDKESGAGRSTLRVVAENIQFLGGKGSGPQDPVDDEQGTDGMSQEQQRRPYPQRGSFQSKAGQTPPPMPRPEPEPVEQTEQTDQGQAPGIEGEYGGDDDPPSKEDNIPF